MQIRFAGPAVLVRDMARSRRFYEDALGQQAVADHGPHVAYHGFSLWLADHATPLLFGPGATPPDPLGGKNFELYFECEALDDAWTGVQARGATVLHPVVEQPWLQRCFRVRDPDGHVVEVGEPLPGLIRRLGRQGLSPEEISARTSIPAAQVHEALGGSTVQGFGSGSSGSGVRT